eukprot:scaffold49048_cov34-Tisochrysis_lutea.AAC.1
MNGNISRTVLELATEAHVKISRLRVRLGKRDGGPGRAATNRSKSRAMIERWPPRDTSERKCKKKVNGCMQLGQGALTRRMCEVLLLEGGN